MKLKELALFWGLEEEEVKKSLSCSQARVLEYDKNSYIFHREDKPERLYVILSGKVLLGQDSFSGRQILAEYRGMGQSFGERELFLEYDAYDYFALSKERTKVLAISHHFFNSTCEKNCPHHHKIIFNMMKIFAEEAERNSKKIQLLTCGTLEQRIALYLLQQKSNNYVIEIPINREELSIYLNTTRPSLSRELSNLQKKEVLRLIDRRHLKILNYGALQKLVGHVTE